MTEVIDEFSSGPYDVLNYTVKFDDGKIVIELNDNDLGRIVFEDVEAIENLEAALQDAKEELVEHSRRKEEL